MKVLSQLQSRFIFWQFLTGGPPSSDSNQSSSGHIFVGWFVCPCACSLLTWALTNLPTTWRNLIASQSHTLKRKKVWGRYLIFHFHLQISFGIIQAKWMWIWLDGDPEPKCKEDSVSWLFLFYFTLTSGKTCSKLRLLLPSLAHHQQELRFECHAK